MIGSLLEKGIGLSKENLYHTDKGSRIGSVQLVLGYSRRLGEEEEEEEEKCQCKARPDFVRAEAKRQDIWAKTIKSLRKTTLILIIYCLII